MLPPPRFQIFLSGLTLAGLAVAEEAPPPVREVAPPTKSGPPPVHQTEHTSDDEAYEPPSTPSAEPIPEPRDEVTGYIGSPIWLSNAPLDPGIELELRAGSKFGMFVPELGVGGRWNWINVDELSQTFPSVTTPERFQDENISAWWISGGLRIEPKVRQTFMPYGSVAFDLNFWTASTDTSGMCGVWTCVITNSVQFAPGFSGRAGIRWMPGPYFGLDLGAKLGMTFPGWAFADAHSWIEPYFGITIVP
jgi:hypothetical protein